MSKCVILPDGATVGNKAVGDGCGVGSLVGWYVGLIGGVGLVGVTRRNNNITSI